MVDLSPILAIIPAFVKIIEQDHGNGMGEGKEAEKEGREKKEDPQERKQEMTKKIAFSAVFC